MSKYKFFIILAAIIVLGGSFSFYVLRNFNTISAEKVMIDSEKITVNSEDNGTLTEIFVKPEEYVTSGQAVAEIQISQNNSTNDEQTQELSYSKQKLDEAENNYTKFAMMYKDGVVSKEEYDNSLKTLEAAKENYTKAKNNISANAQVQPVTKKIYAPENGTVSVNYIKKGEITTKNSPLILIKTAAPKITAYFDKKFQHQIKEGAQVSINIGGYEGKHFEGVIEKITGENTSNQTEVLIRFTTDVSKIDFDNKNSISVTLKK